MTAALLLLLSLADQPPTKVPRIAKAAGITLGVTTFEQFQRDNGKGLTLAKLSKTGIAARFWYDADSKVLIQAESEYRSGQNHVIDSLNVDFMDPSNASIDGKRPPTIQLKKASLGLLSVLHAGMSRLEVVHATGSTIDSHEQSHAAGIVSYRPELRSAHMPAIHGFKSWRVRFDFGHDGLTGLKMWASE